MWWRRKRDPGILRHQPVHDGFVPAEGLRPEAAEAIDRHIERHFGPVESVYHEMLSHLVAVHVHVIGPTAERPYRTLITTGMSERPMSVPAEAEVSPYAELMIALPPQWPVPGTYPSGDERADWPITLLKQLARLPHEYRTWLGHWHTIPNGDPATPYAPGVPFTGVIVTPMLMVPDEARTIRAADGTEINLLALVPLHPAEMAFKLRRGSDALTDALDRGGVTELVDPDRPSCV
ncbi:suppressor of fused domain protein [Actinoplanes sp. NPDC024001]|uniref:suppressor of fused domain protein n=1 Tax=Actinoplanes sp. NPDC024001 TaxID=3154598 RepID=UPI0033C850F5